MPSLNKVQLIGHLGKDPEIKSFSNGGRIANFSLATSESWKDKTTGEKKEKTEWHRVTVSAEGAIKFIEKYAKKGDAVYVEGKIETRKYTDKDGAEKYATEIIVRPYGGDFKILSSKRTQENQSASEAAPEPFEDEIPF